MLIVVLFLVWLYCSTIRLVCSKSIEFIVAPFIIAHIPVSYTHLDVYKRQRLKKLSKDKGGKVKSQKKREASEVKRTKCATLSEVALT